MTPFRFLIAESESPEEREKRRESAGSSSGETYAETLRAIAPGALCELIRPAEDDGPLPSPEMIGAHDAVFFSGAPMHVYADSPEVRRMLEFTRGVFAAGVPSFGSCAGLQLAVAAAGGRVGERAEGQEAGFARRITPTQAGREHPMLRGRPPSFDAPAIHGDEVTELPPDAVLLATSTGTRVQAAEIRCGEGVFWGVQYHPEIGLEEIAQSLRRQADTLVKRGLATDHDAAENFAGQVETLGRDPGRRDVAWQLGLDEETTVTERRQRELRNFIGTLAEPRRAKRSGG